MLPYLTLDRFTCFILIVKQSQRCWRPLCFEGHDQKRSSTFLRKKVHPGDLARGCTDLEMTWLLCCAGDAADKNGMQLNICAEMQSLSMTSYCPSQRGSVEYIQPV